MTVPEALLVEDAEEFVRLGRRLLEQEGFEVEVARTGEVALELARRRDFEVFLVDVTLPGIDGFEVCRQLRSFTDGYVLMVTGRSEEVDKVVGFRVGADDYVTKPYSPAELSARISAMRRRPRVSASVGRQLGRLHLDADGREVRVDGEPLSLTKIEFDLLQELTSAPQRVFSRAQLLASVWGYAEGGAHVVDVHIGNLRRKLRAVFGEQDPIRTVRGVGYKYDTVS